MEETLWQSIQTLEPLKPRFVSVTYGAGGSTRERTHSTVGRIVRETGLAPAAPLPCVSASRDEIAEVAREYRSEERRVGREGVSTRRSRGWAYHKKKKHNKTSNH